MKKRKKTSSKKPIKKVQTRKKKKDFVTHREGYFNKNFAYYSLKSIQIMFPMLDKKDMSREFELSEKTIDKLLSKPTSKLRVRKDTLKKITKGIAKNLNLENQILFTEIMNHLRRYNGISKKKIKEFRKRAEEMKKRYTDYITDDYFFFRALYEKI